MQFDNKFGLGVIITVLTYLISGVRVASQMFSRVGYLELQADKGDRFTQQDAQVLQSQVFENTSKIGEIGILLEGLDEKIDLLLERSK